MKVDTFVRILDCDFFTGVPDSQLKALCNYLMDRYGIDPKHHVIAANEGNCTALAAGYHLATGKVPAVYLQNSGEGNIINPVVSLMSEKVYAIPTIFIIGWRGEPGVEDEPQHVLQGEVTLSLLETIGIDYFIISNSTPESEMAEAMIAFKERLKEGRNVAFVIRKNAFSDAPNVRYHNNNTMIREEVIQKIVKVAGQDPIVSTTGKASRELFETRVTNKQSHKYDFLTVGSMGHCSSIALSIAINKPHQRVWCIDGDGAVLMHMGSLALVGTIKPENMIHLVINNCAHETVGGMPTIAGSIDLVTIARACGYSSAVRVSSYKELDRELAYAKSNRRLSFIEAMCAIGARNDLGRPTMSTVESKRLFFEYLRSL